MKNFFCLEEKGTNVRTEVLAGITTFMTMAYILAVNPAILAEAGMPRDSVFTATVLASFLATIFMAFLANLPIALAPGMGLNAFFAYSVVLNMGYSWQLALTAVFVEGILFVFMSFFNVREAIIASIPKNIKSAVSVGIGLFIAFIGLQNAEIIVKNPATMVSLGKITNGPALLAIVGIIFTSFFLAKKIKGALLIGMVATTLIGIPFGITKIAEGWSPVSNPAAPLFFQFQFDKIFTMDFLVVMFTFLFVDVFDTVGTLVGVTSQGGIIQKDGQIPKVKQALLADAIGTTVGACLGTSTVTSYIESASGVAEGGKTGLTALTTGILFLLSLFLAPLFLIVPKAATAPVLILVGLFMLSPIKEIDLSDFTESLPAYLTILIMPFSYSIAEGLVFGILAYIFLKILSGKAKEIPFTGRGAASRRST